VITMARDWEPEREPLPAAISDLWSQWAAGRLTFEEYLQRAMAVSQALTELEAAEDDPDAL
jgi:hypothetical protein